MENVTFSLAHIDIQKAVYTVWAIAMEYAWHVGVAYVQLYTDIE